MLAFKPNNENTHTYIYIYIFYFFIFFWGGEGGYMYPGQDVWKLNKAKSNLKQDK